MTPPFALEDGDTGESILPARLAEQRRAFDELRALEEGLDEVDKVKGANASIAPDARVKLLVGLSRWERAGMLAWIAALQPDVFDDAAKALGCR